MNYVIWQHVFLVTFFSDHKYNFLLYELLCTSSAAIVTIALFDVFDILMNSKHYWWFLGLSSVLKSDIYCTVVFTGLTFDFSTGTSHLVSSVR